MLKDIAKTLQLDDPEDGDLVHIDEETSTDQTAEELAEYVAYCWALGARVVEKHFTDDVTRSGPDHGFSLDPETWRAMVDDTRMLEAALGTGIKGVEANEQETVVLQRRCVRATRDLPRGTVLVRADLEVLRPAPADAIPAHEVNEALGRVIVRDLVAGEDVKWADLS